MPKNKTDEEKEFMRSLSALMVRYNIKLQKSMLDHNDDNDVSWEFVDLNGELDGIYVNMEEFHTYLIQIQKKLGI